MEEKRSEGTARTAHSLCCRLLRGRKNYPFRKTYTRTQCRGYRVGSIKHDVHGFELDKPGKDSWRHKHAGASTTVISSHSQIGMVMDVDHDHHPDELKGFFTNVDIILTEGYKQGNKPKLEIFRNNVHEEPLCKNDEHLIALISDMRIDLGVPQFSLDDIDGLADFLISSFDL